MNEIVFEVSQEGDGGFVAECLTEAIFTQANNWEELRRNVKEAVAAFYFDQAKRPVAQSQGTLPAGYEGGRSLLGPRNFSYLNTTITFTGHPTPGVLSPGRGGVI